jgi:hypothetical protein
LTGAERSVWRDRYGRGSRESALRSARALALSPISASSAAAWTAVETISPPDGAAARRATGAASRVGGRALAGPRAGVPAGWAG